MRALSVLLMLSLVACEGGEPADVPAEGDAAEAGDPPKNIPAPADVTAAPADAEVTASGLASKVLQAGTGAMPSSERDTVTVHYTGWTTDGEMFDSSVTRGEPTSFPLNRVIAGWTEGLQLMKIGEKRRLWIPEDLAYKGRRGAPQGTLVFDVELLEIEKAPEPPPVPEDVAAPPADGLKTASGLVSKVLQEGSGEMPTSERDVVQVHYSGWTTDGELFDSSVTRGKPSSFPLNRVIPGWTEGLQLMKVGEKRRFWIPVELAYNNQPGKPPGMLVFDVELLELTKPPEPPPVPDDVAAAPADAEVTASGLASKLLSAGSGETRPTASSRVEVHYSGWTTDGKMFDSSVARGRTTTFPLNGVIAGWTEGLQLMTVGEKRRFWIPEALAYQGKPGKPAGMLVFDVELVAIK